MLEKTYRLATIGLLSALVVNIEYSHNGMISRYFTDVSVGVKETFFALASGGSYNPEKQCTVELEGGKQRCDSVVDIPNCGEEILHFGRIQNFIIIKIFTLCVHFFFSPLDLFGTHLGNFKESPLNFQPTYGVKAFKICASCEKFHGRNDELAGFQQYCGSSVYGYNETMTGIIFLPVNQSLNTIKPGVLHVSNDEHD